MCSQIQLCPHQTITCSKCLQMFSSCARGCHYDFVVNNTWKVSFKNSSGPLKLQVLGVRYNACSVSTACSASCHHTKQEQLSHMTSRMWELNHRLGTSSPCKAISKLSPGRKGGQQIACFQLAYLSTLKQPVSWSTCEYIMQGHGTGWKLLRNKRRKCVFSVLGKAAMQQ